MGLRRSASGTFDGPFVRVAKWMLDRGVHPNHLTFAQIPVFGLEIWAALEGHNWLFVSTIVLVMALDGGDGILARVGGLASRKGAVLDAMFDTLGIAVIMWGAGQFFPEAANWFLALFLANGILYLQNAVLEEKMVSYLRGPTILAITGPGFLLGALWLSSFIVAWIFFMRLPRTVHALGSLEPTP